MSIPNENVRQRIKIHIEFNMHSIFKLKMIINSSFLNISKLDVNTTRKFDEIDAQSYLRSLNKEI